MSAFGAPARREYWARGDLSRAVGAAALVLALRLLLAILPWRVVRRLVEHIARRLAGRPRDALPADDAAVVRAVDRAARRTGAPCLAQGLAGLLLYAARGVRARLHIGVRRGGDEPFGAHAWLETASGTVVGAVGARDFAPLLVVDPHARPRS